MPKNGAQHPLKFSRLIKALPIPTNQRLWEPNIHSLSKIWQYGLDALACPKLYQVVWVSLINRLHYF